MMSLYRTFPLPQQGHVAVDIAQDLFLHVPAAPGGSLFDKDHVVVEGRSGLRAGGPPCLHGLIRVIYEAYPASASARGGLDDHRIADLHGDPLRILLGENACQSICVIV